MLSVFRPPLPASSRANLAFDGQKRNAPHDCRRVIQPWSSRQRRALVKVRARKHVGELGADEPIAPFVEEAAAASHGLFDDSFKSALASALSRNGTASLLEGQERLNDENRISAQEEVLRAAIMACRATLMKLQMIHQESEKAIELEKKQLERLQFALEKARNDAAYYRSLSMMMDEGNTSDS
ncbi:hypothetical protein V8C86DRAFT_2509309 [Haematococcus lacustris]